MLLNKKNLLLVFLISLTAIAGVRIFSPANAAVKNELVVLSHGLGRSDAAMWRLEDQLENAGFEVCAIDYETIGHSVEEILSESRQQISHCIQDDVTIHFVGHSLGGLVIRHYLTQPEKEINEEEMGQIVFMGTPNKGSEVADHMKDQYMVKKFGGEISQALMTGASSLGSQLPENTLPVGIIAGTKSSKVTSHLFDEDNDGLVSISSAKLANMKDFVAIHVGHSAMRYNTEVANQVIHFLEHGQFKR